MLNDSLHARGLVLEDFERLYAEAGFRLTGVFPTRSNFSVIEGAPV